MNYISFIAKRYLFSKSGNNAINIIVKIASFGVLIVSAAFIIVLSGFSGIRTFNLNLIKMTDADLRITPVNGKTFVYNKFIDSVLKKENNIKAYSKVIDEKVFINYKDKQKIAKIKGVDSNYYKVIALDSSLISGSLPQYDTAELLLGVSLANELSFYLSNAQIEVINVIVPKPGKGIITDPRKAFNNKYFIPSGIFQTTPDHDLVYMYANLPEVQELLHYQPQQISAIEIKIHNPQLLPQTQDFLKQQFSREFNVTNRKEQNKLLYKMLNTENLMLYFIFTLILLLALFNIIGTLMMIIIDKKEDAGILKMLGIHTQEIKKIFMLQGLGMTLLSGLSGLILGLLLVYLQIQRPFLYIPQTTMAYPVEIHLSNILWVLLTLIFMAFLSTLIAVRSIKNQS